mgnify:CR=1 FL=1
MNSGMKDIIIEYNGKTAPQCSEETFNECKIGYIVVPIEYDGETICGQQVKSIGKCGESEEECQWTYYYQEKMLRIEGKGDMESYSAEKQAPWNIKKDIIEKISVEGIISIGDFAFMNHKKLETIIISDDIIEIGKNPFIECSSLKTIKANHS